MADLTKEVLDTFLKRFRSKKKLGEWLGKLTEEEILALAALCNPRIYGSTLELDMTFLTESLKRKGKPVLIDSAILKENTKEKEELSGDVMGDDFFIVPRPTPADEIALEWFFA